MERKLLSLPSFFVLLLIAGIAFLAAPVEDVQATAPKVTAAGLTGTVGSATLAADGTTTAGTITVTIPFDQAVKISAGALTATSVAGTAAVGDGFGVEDIAIHTFPASATDADITAGTGGTALSPGLSNANLRGNAAVTGPPALAANQVFTLTFPVPSADGKIKIAISGTGFEDLTDSMNYVSAPADHVVLEFDGMAPTVRIARSGINDDETVTGRFEVTFTLSEDVVTSGDGAFTATDITFSDIPTPAGQTAPATPDPSATVAQFGTRDADDMVRVLVDPAAGVESVGISVKAGVVRDAGGNGNGATAVTTVNVDNTPPTVMIEVGPEVTTTPGTGPGASPTYSAGDDDFTVFFILSEAPGDSGEAAFVEADIDITGGSVTSLEQIEALDIRFEATVEQDDTTATQSVDLKVSAGAFEDVVGNSNNASTMLTVSVTGGDAPPVDPGPQVIDTGTGDELTGDRVGFSFALNANHLPLPNAANTNRHLVLAKKPPTDDDEGAGFTAGVPSAQLINIDDALWVDLRLFLVTREGGTIDLIKQGNGAPVKSLVISEVMWGNDNGLSDPTNSQWIELYNTTGAAISGTWEVVFTAKNRGGAMLTGDDAKAKAGAAALGGLTTTASPVVDKLSTWRDVGSYWDWRISDSAGGSHGQSGKSTPNSATSIGNPLELVSMQRKIDYAKVQKGDHKPNAVDNRIEQLKGVPGGVAAGNWEATPEHGAMLNWRRGTPGAAPTIKKVDKSGVARGSVVFNEIANRSDKKYEWIELYNKSSSAKKINDWMLSVVSIVDGTRDDREILTFTSGTNGDDIVVPAKGYLLVVQTDPRNTPLEGGYDVVNPGNSARQSDGAGNKPSRLYYVSDKLDIPKENFLLILRHGKDKRATHEKVEDIAGHNPRFDDDAKSTQVWPLNSWSVGALDDLGEKNDKTWRRDQGKDIFHGDAWKDNGGFTGLGIDRKYKSSDSHTSGTPGYNNDAVKGEVKSDGLTHANPVIISEIMFGAGNGRVPQWIELHNPSHTQAVNLKNWKLEIFNYRNDETLEVDYNAELTLPEVRIQPNQTVLIVSTSGRNSGSDEFPDDRIINVWSNTDLRGALKMSDRRDAILSATGFHLRLSDPRKTVVDEVGNIDANRRTNDEPDWELPGGNFDGNKRSSMVRDLEGAAGDGTERDAWRDAVAVMSDAIKADELYYGDNDDIGTPGYTPGGVLPVQLSSFYSKRNDAGAVVITWSTESELDNAGFNILRSMSRTGEFTRINAQLIPGAGTTGEKNTYTWTDTSARPNVVYYYQIEDVSLEGEHRTLRTTRLRGHVGAAGKATVIWGELKSRK